jgi:uncharacterized protein YgbK (DUF1537 family)
MDELQRMGIHLVEFDPERRAFEGANELKEQSRLAVRILPSNGQVTDRPLGKLLESFVEALMALQKNFDPDGVGIIGGETAYQLLKALGARGLEVFGCHAEVIASSQIAGGAMDGCRFVSKGGSVGADDAACQMLSLLTM